MMAQPVKSVQQAKATKERGVRTAPKPETKLKNWGPVKGQTSLFD